MRKQDVDATRAALERIARDGSDLGRPLSMDFFVAVPNEMAGHMMVARVANLGFEAILELDPESEEWTCYCTKVIVPKLDTVVAIESQLDSLARDIGGYVDGFGTFGNADLPNDRV